MMNLVDIPTVVSALITFVASGGTEAAIETIKGISVNGATKLIELKDELIVKPAVHKAIEQYKQDFSNMEARSELDQQLTQILENHPVFNDASINIEGGVSAKKGSVAAVKITGDINMTNNFK